MTPALTLPIVRHLPLYMYRVSEPQSSSTNVSVLSVPAEVRLHAKSSPRPMNTTPGCAGE